MVKFVRIKGGEKNSKSGIRWSEQELVIVLELYLKSLCF